MKVLFCSSEVFPFSKTGGLADMAYFLPKSLKQLGHDVTIITPYYQNIGSYHEQMTFIGRADIQMGGIHTSCNYFQLIYQDIPIVFVQNMHYFERQHLYGYNDDAERFTCFSYAVLDYMRVSGHYPHILHLNDWQTGMIPYLLDEHYRSINDQYYSIHTLLSIHNLEYQGSFDPYVSRFFNTDFNFTYIHFDRVNFLKAGIERATKINTVSPTYQQEVMTGDYGFTLDGALSHRRDDFIGILNGIDDAVFNPKTDRFLIANYDLRNTSSGKQKNKAFIYEQFGLGQDLDTPLIAYVGRLATQKGINLMTPVLEEVLTYSNAKFILMGSGNDSYQDYFRYLTGKYPDRVANYIGFNERMAHIVYAASDIFMMPSRFEPCGLGQMIAMTYGSLPVVRETGGLKDTVIPYNQYTGEGTGFSFRNYEPHELKDKLFESINLYTHEKAIWRSMVRQAMKQDFGLQKMAFAYEKLYQIILGV